MVHKWSKTANKPHRQIWLKFSTELLVPTRPPGWLKKAPRSPRCTQNGPKGSQDSPKVGEVGPKWAKIAPKWPPNKKPKSPKIAPTCPKMVPRWPKMAPTWPKIILYVCFGLSQVYLGPWAISGAPELCLRFAFAFRSGRAPSS